MANDRDDLHPGQLYALESDPEAFLSEFGTSQYFRLSGKTFEWKACKYDSDLNREKNNLPRNNGLAIGVRCLELNFDIELPIWTQGLGAENKLYPKVGTPVSIWDVWHLASVVVFGDYFPLYPNEQKPCFINFKNSYFWGDANSLKPCDIISTVQRLLHPRKRHRCYRHKRHWIRQVAWVPQCFSNSLSLQITQSEPTPAQSENDEIGWPLDEWSGRRIDEAIKEELYLDQIDSSWIGPLHWCIRNGDCERFEQLLKSGANINFPAEHDLKTPLHFAVEPEVKTLFLRILLKRGADLESIETFRNRTPLGYAVRLGNLPAVKKLVEAGASVERNPITKQSPLDIAFEKDRMPIIEYLSTIRGARNRSWSRRLLLAVQALKIDQVEWLLAKGANPKTKNAEGQTPSDLVWEKLNHPWMVSKRGRFDEKKSSPCFQILGLLEGKKHSKGAN